MPRATTMTPLDLLRVPLDGVRLVEASAGTGKTWAICALVLRLVVERGLAIGQVLVVTFTIAATAELRERVRARLRLALQMLHGERPADDDAFIAPWLDRLRAQGMDPARIERRLARALAAFDEAAVFTIHGFCQRALGDAAFSAQQPLRQDLLADDHALRLQVINDFWRREVAAAALPAPLLDHLLRSGDQPAHWAHVLQRCTARPLAEQRWPAALGAARTASAGSSTAASVQTLHSAAADAAQHWQAARAALLALLHADSGLSRTSYKPARIDRAGAAWDDWFDAGDALAALPDDALLLTADRLAGGARKGHVAPRHAFFDAAQRLADQQVALQQTLRLARLALLRRLLDEAPRQLADLKRQQRVLTFDDLLAKLHQRLHGPDGPALAAALRQRFPAALIDEFQDTDPLQWAIFRRLYGAADDPAARTLFLVGDPKQAIYGFRNADLATYLAARGVADSVHTLLDNQRAVPALVAAVNALFGRHAQPFMREQLAHWPAGVGSKPRPALVDRSGAPRAALELWQLPRTPDGAPLARALAVDAAVQATATEIARLLAAGQRGEVQITPRADPTLRGGDIAVLVRSHAQGRLMRERLAALNVGSVELSQQSVWHSAEAADLQRLLAAVAEPAREGLVKAALASALIGIDADELLRLPDDTPRWVALLQALADLQALWRQHGIGVLLRRLLDQPWLPRSTPSGGVGLELTRVKQNSRPDPGDSLTARLLAGVDGARRLTNVLHLGELLQRAERTQRTPAALLRWLQGRRADPLRDDDSLLRLESDRQLVQIVTIHRAKGLEYPLVFCPFLWDGRPRDSGAQPPLLWQDDAGRTLIDWRGDGEAGEQAGEMGADVFDLAAARLRRRQAEAAEGLRLVYVALTRAVQRCTLVVGPYLSPAGAHFSDKPSRGGPLSWLVGGEGFTADGWCANAEQATLPSLQVLDAGWQTLVDAANGDAVAQATTAGGAAGTTPAAAALRPLPENAGQPLPRDDAGAAPLAALPPPRGLPAPWRIGSYSGLVNGAEHELAAQDHDGQPDADGNGSDGVVDDAGHAGWAAATPAPAAVDRGHGGPAPSPGTGAHADTSRTGAASAAPHPDDILHFARGTHAGVCLHAVFENAEFTQPAGWPAAVADALRVHGAALPGARDAATRRRWARQLQAMLADVLHTPLPAGDGVPALTLAAKPPSARVAELAFHLPATALSSADLAALLAAHGYPLPALAPSLLRGWLTGFIDAVVCHHGRWYLIDWKSNHLGSQPADYAGDALAVAMARSGYHLQHLLYSVALDRWLALRLAGYDRARHFGGALYLFVRGVRPAWRQADGAPCGVYFNRPSPALLNALSALLQGADGGR